MTDVFLAPHLDDAVLSCGEMLARLDSPKVVTVFAGRPQDPLLLTAHDKECGFVSSRVAVHARRSEDHNAGNVLCFDPFWCDLPENGYRDEPIDPDRVADAIRPHIERAGTVYAPLGLLHPDHVVLADVAQQVTYSLERALVVYEELPYRVELPIETYRRVEARGLFGGADLDEPPRGDLALKRTAVACYTSQLTSLDLDCCFARERYWRLDWDRIST